MNKLYVLNNLLDESLFFKNSSIDTRIIKESRLFSNRNLAEKFLMKRNLTEKYSVKLISNINESNGITGSEITSAIDDTKDMIDTTLELVEMYLKNSELSEEVFDGGNAEDILDKLKKLKKHASGICFRPSFYDSDGSGLVSDLSTAKDPEISSDKGGSTND